MRQANNFVFPFLDERFYKFIKYDIGEHFFIDGMENFHHERWKLRWNLNWALDECWLRQFVHELYSNNVVIGYHSISWKAQYFAFAGWQIFVWLNDESMQYRRQKLLKVLAEIWASLKFPSDDNLKANKTAVEDLVEAVRRESLECSKVVCGVLQWDCVSSVWVRWKILHKIILFIYLDERKTFLDILWRSWYWWSSECQHFGIKAASSGKDPSEVWVQMSEDVWLTSELFEWPRWNVRGFARVESFCSLRKLPLLCLIDFLRTFLNLFSQLVWAHLQGTVVYLAETSCLSWRSLLSKVFRSLEPASLLL